MCRRRPLPASAASPRPQSRCGRWCRQGLPRCGLSRARAQRLASPTRRTPPQVSCVCFSFLGRSHTSRKTERGIMGPSPEISPFPFSFSPAAHVHMHMHIHMRAQGAKVVSREAAWGADIVLKVRAPGALHLELPGPASPQASNQFQPASGEPSLSSSSSTKATHEVRREQAAYPRHQEGCLLVECEPPPHLTFLPSRAWISISDRPALVELVRTNKQTKQQPTVLSLKIAPSARLT